MTAAIVLLAILSAPTLVGDRVCYTNADANEIDRAMTREPLLLQKIADLERKDRAADVEIGALRGNVRDAMAQATELQRQAEEMDAAGRAWFRAPVTWLLVGVALTLTGVAVTR